MRERERESEWGRVQDARATALSTVFGEVIRILTEWVTSARYTGRRSEYEYVLCMWLWMNSCIHCAQNFTISWFLTEAKFQDQLTTRYDMNVTQYLWLHKCISWDSSI